MFQIKVRKSHQRKTEEKLKAFHYTDDRFEGLGKFDI